MTSHLGPPGPSVTDGPTGPSAIGPFITLSPVGSDGMHSLCDSDQPMADGPVGPSVTLGPGGPRWDVIPV